MDLDQLARTVKDLEYRVKLLERDVRKSDPEMCPKVRDDLRQINGWCSCGRDVCRAPDCPSHKPDPMGR